MCEFRCLCDGPKAPIIEKEAARSRMEESTKEGRERGRAQAHTYLPLVVIGKLGNGRRLPRPLQTHKHNHVGLPLLHLIGLGA